MKRFALTLLVATLIAAPALLAQTETGPASATLSWSHNGMNTDGSPATLKGFKIYYGTTSGEYTSTVTIDNPDLRSYVVEGLQSDTTYYFVSTAVATSGVESVFSNEATKTTPPSTPSAPVLTIGTDPTAYAIIESRNQVALLPVGVVQPGATCDPAQEIMGKHVVDRAFVDWYGTGDVVVMPEVVVALCDG